MGLFASHYWYSDTGSIGPTINPGDSGILSTVVSSNGEKGPELRFEEHTTGTPGSYLPAGEQAFPNPVFDFNGSAPPDPTYEQIGPTLKGDRPMGATPDYETPVKQDLGSNASARPDQTYEQVGATLKSGRPMRPTEDDYEVMAAAPVKQAEKELRSFEDATKPRAVENPYEREPTEYLGIEDLDEYALL